MPKLSIILIIHRMANQADNTLFSLSTQFQRNVDEKDYEVIAVENSSGDVLGQARATAHGNNIRYYYREETSTSPVAAINFGFDQCLTPYIGLMIDGARIASPRIVEYALAAKRMCEHPLVIVPGYHLGDTEHHHHTAGETEGNERRMLQAIDWKKNGYDLFTVSCLSGANASGPLGPFLESNCIFCPRDGYDQIGRADPRFNLPGGGSVNIHMYHALARLPQNKLVVLPGEGTFHQFHGGVTTAEIPDRARVLESHRKNLRRNNGGQFNGVHREPLILGDIPLQATQQLKSSAEVIERRFKTCQRRAMPLWPGEPANSERRGPQPSKPVLSILVCDRGSVSDLENTLHSLSPEYQHHVQPGDYEVVVAARSRHATLERRARSSFGRHVRFEVCEDPCRSLESSLRSALMHTQARVLCPLIAGMPVVTPRLIEHVLYAERMFEQPLMLLPTYRLANPKLAIPFASRPSARRMLKRLAWRSDGYELFAHTRVESSGHQIADARFLETFYYFFPRTTLERYVESGSGSREPNQLNRILLTGEGAFRQCEGSKKPAWQSWFVGQQTQAPMIQIAEGAQEATILGTPPGQFYRLLSQLPIWERSTHSTGANAA